MQQLFLEAPGRYVWRDVAEPEITNGEQAVVRPLVVACCDLDVAVAAGQVPLPTGYAVGHEGIGEVVSVGDEVSDVRVGQHVIVPFQISCGRCRTCQRGATGTCDAVPLMSTFGLGPIAGLDGGGFMSDLVLVPYADAMLVSVPDGIDPVAIASMSDNIPDAWRTVGPYRDVLAAANDSERRVLVVGGFSIGLYAAALASAMGAEVDYVDTNPIRLATAERLGATVHDLPRPLPNWNQYPVTVHTSADPEALSATLALTWPEGVCTDTGMYFDGPVPMPLLEMYIRGVRFVTGRVNARAVIPQVLEAVSAGVDLSPAVGQTVPWEEAPAAWAEMEYKTVFTRLKMSP